MLSPVLLERLRVWWRVARAQGKMLDGGWLFPGLNPVEPLSARQLNRAIHAAAEAAQIDKRVSMHTLRHSLRHPPAGAEGRYPGDPGPARAQEAGNHGALCPGRHRHPARSRQSAGDLNPRRVRHGAARPGGRGHLPRPRAGVAPSASGHLSLGSSRSCRPSNSAAARRWGDTCCAATPARTSRSATTPAATGTARSARPGPRNAGSRPGRPICCRSSITTWSSPAGADQCHRLLPTRR
jgi:hypothetical protein